MNVRNQQTANLRIDYRWRVDRQDGFDKASLSYDANGKLRAVDYQASAKQREAKRNA